MSEAVFAYGTLAVADVMRAVTGRDFAGGAALLRGYARSRLRDREYPGVAPSPGSVTPGVVYAGVDAHSLALLDRFEGDLYQRRRLRIERADAESGEAHVYVIAPDHAALLTGESWSPEQFTRSGLDAWLERCRAFHASESEWIRERAR